MLNLIKEISDYINGEKIHIWEYFAASSISSLIPALIFSKTLRNIRLNKKYIKLLKLIPRKYNSKVEHRLQWISIGYLAKSYFLSNLIIGISFKNAHENNIFIFKIVGVYTKITRKNFIHDIYDKFFKWKRKDILDNLLDKNGNLYHTEKFGEIIMVIEGINFVFKIKYVG